MILRQARPLLHLLLSTGVVFALSGVSIGSDTVDDLQAGSDFGAGLTLGEVTPLAEVVRDPERYMGDGVLVRGRISDVCQKKGCWTVLSDGEAHIRVRFKDYGFFLPTDSSGKQAYVEGVVESVRISEETARHYSRESVSAGASKRAGESKSSDASEIRGEQREVGFTATGVRLVAVHTAD